MRRLVCVTISWAALLLLLSIHHTRAQLFAGETAEEGMWIDFFPQNRLAQMLTFDFYPAFRDESARANNSYIG